MGYKVFRINNSVPNISNVTENKQIFAKARETENELFAISHYFLVNIIFLPYSFANILFKISSKGSIFTINDDLNDKLFI